MNLLQVQRLVRIAVVIYLLNAMIAVGLAIYQFQKHLTAAAALTVGRTLLSASAIALLLVALKLFRDYVEFVEEHADFLRKMVLIVTGKSGADPALAAELRHLAIYGPDGPPFDGPPKGAISGP